MINLIKYFNRWKGNSLNFGNYMNLLLNELGGVCRTQECGSFDRSETKLTFSIHHHSTLFLDTLGSRALSVQMKPESEFFHVVATIEQCVTKCRSRRQYEKNIQEDKCTINTSAMNICHVKSVN